MTERLKEAWFGTGLVIFEDRRISEGLPTRWWDMKFVDVFSRSDVCTGYGGYPHFSLREENGLSILANELQKGLVYFESPGRGAFDRFLKYIYLI